MINSALIEVSKACNLACPYCLSRSGEPNPDELTAEEIIEFLDTFPLLADVKLTGGEPFMPVTYNKTYAVTKYCVDRGIHVQINTNGTFEIPDFDLSTELVNFQVSIDGMKETHDANRGEGVFDKAINFINTMRYKGYRVNTMAVITEPNWADIQVLIPFVSQELGIEPKFQVVSPVGRAEDMIIDAEKVDMIVNRIIELGGKCRPRITICNTMLGNGSTRIAFDDTGNIIPCTYLGEYKFGHISEFNELRTRIKMRNTMGSKTCSCPTGACTMSKM